MKDEFNYDVTIGEYNASVRVAISFRLKGVRLTDSEYKKLVDAVDVITGLIPKEQLS